VTLLGDAAHPMVPALGQGACQAIEDGVILGKMLGASEDDPATLRAYETKRIERTAPIVKRARMQGKLMQGDNAVMDVVRANFFRFAPTKQVLKGFQEFLTYEG
jgi:2-polyprenyl-6-methoxyphenol hydroxylase-like FAD-dependent oxidoreductase